MWVGMGGKLNGGLIAISHSLLSHPWMMHHLRVFVALCHRFGPLKTVQSAPRKIVSLKPSRQHCTKTFNNNSLATYNDVRSTTLRSPYRSNQFPNSKNAKYLDNCSCKSSQCPRCLQNDRTITTHLSHNYFGGHRHDITLYVKYCTYHGSD